MIMSDSVKSEIHVSLRDPFRPNMAVLAPQDSKLETSPPTQELNQDSMEDTQRAVNNLIGVWLKELETDDELRQQIQKIRQCEKMVKLDATTQMGQVEHIRDIRVIPTDYETVTLRDNVRPDMATSDPRDSSELVAEDLPSFTREDSIEDAQKKANKLIGVWLEELEKDDELRQLIQTVRQREEYDRNVKKLTEQFECELRVVESSYCAEVSRLNNKLEEKKRELVTMGQICQGLDRQLREKEEELREKDEQLSEKDEELEEKDETIRQLEKQLNQIKHQRAERREEIRENMEKKVIVLASRMINGRQVIEEMERVTFQNSHTPETGEDPAFN